MCITRHVPANKYRIESQVSEVNNLNRTESITYFKKLASDENVIVITYGNLHISMHICIYVHDIGN